MGAGSVALKAHLMDRFIESDADKEMLIRFIRDQAVPFLVAITKGSKRTSEQNRLQRLWCNEIADQLGDTTAEEVRGYCKLTIGIPILREASEQFREQYDTAVKPLPYERKMALMMEPLDLPVTRCMTTKQKAEYLDGIQKHFAERGIVLTQPEERAATT